MIIEDSRGQTYTPQIDYAYNLDTRKINLGNSLVLNRRSKLKSRIFGREVLI